jgi:hypothetical protein
LLIGSRAVEAQSVATIDGKAGRQISVATICVSEHPFSGTSAVAEDEPPSVQSNKRTREITPAEGKAIRNPRVSFQCKIAQHKSLAVLFATFGS